MPSRHAANAAVAAANHAQWFGDPTAAEYREGPNCAWTTLAYAVIHGETIGWVRKGTPQISSKVVRCNIHVPVGTAVRLHGHVRIGGDCGAQYTIVDILAKSARVQLTLQRADLAEVTRPNYRGPVME
jgi:hypothetical protein